MSKGAAKPRSEVLQGTLDLMILKTLQALGPQHVFGLARRIEQTSGGHLSVNYGTIYPALLKLEQEGFVSSSWGVSENNRKAKFYRLTAEGSTTVAPRDQDMGSLCRRCLQGSWRDGAIA